MNMDGLVILIEIENKGAVMREGNEFGFDKFSLRCFSGIIVEIWV